MPTTANFSLEYPDDNSSVDIAGHFETLADDVDTAINTRLALSGGTLTGALVGTLTTDSSSSTTGAFKTAGGMGIAKALYVGTTLNVTGATTLTGTLNGKVVNDLVTGPASATDNALVRFDNTTGKVVQNSGITVNDSGYITSDLTVTGATTLTGDLTISKASATARINATSGDSEVHIDRTAGNGAYVVARTGTSSRWRFGAGSDVESGSNVGSDFILGRFSDAGSYIDAPLTVYRSTGKVSIGSVGATAGLQLGAGGPRMMSGTGSPESVVTAPVGSIWFQSDSTVGITHWKKASGAGNTGWVVMSGDTGWRDIASLANSIGTLTLGFWRLNRVGNVVTMALIWADSQTTPYRVELGTLPYGFRPALTFYQHVPYDSTVNGNYRNLYIGDAGVVQYGGPTDARSHNGSFTWTTTNAWPTSLPGSAA